MAFVRSDWNRGIESWRFNVPTDMSRDQTTRATTVFDRTLLRAGETVSMKHLMREETLSGFAFPSHLPSRVTIRHLGSGQTYHLPLKWAADQSADSTFPIPAAAKLGEYSVTLDDGRPSNADADSDDSATIPVAHEHRYRQLPRRGIPLAGVQGIDWHSRSEDRRARRRDRSAAGGADRICVGWTGIESAGASVGVDERHIAAFCFAVRSVQLRAVQKARRRRRQRARNRRRRQIERAGRHIDGKARRR